MSGERRLARAGRIGGRVGEVLSVESPERLHGDVEGTVRHCGDPYGEGQQLDQLERWVHEPALAVQQRQRRIGPVQAEDPLEPCDLRAAGEDRLLD